MIVAPIPVGARLVDSTGLTPGICPALKAAGVDGLIGYLGGCLTPALVAAAMANRLGIVPVNYSHEEGWIPSAALGEADAVKSTRLLAALGIPMVGLVDWCDLEGAGADPTAYLNSWSEIVAEEARLAGLYVGAGGLLSGPQLYGLPRFTRYWRSLSMGIPEPQCGFCLDQLYPSTVCAGLLVDYNFAQQDFEGRVATWVVAD